MCAGAVRSGFLGAVLLLAACGGSTGGSVDTDGGNLQPPDASVGECSVFPAPTGCGAACGSDADCGPFTFCRNRMCDADCTSDGAGCAANEECTAQGRCTPVIPDAGVTLPDGGVMVCPDINITLERIVPDIYIMLDYSSSMHLDFNGRCQEGFVDIGGVTIPDCVGPVDAPSRFQAAREFLIGSDGVIGALEDVARFSLSTYAATPKADCGFLFCSVEEICPDRQTTPLRLNANQGISQVLTNSQPLGGTPTAEAYAALLDDISTPLANPTAIVLITDGEPFPCGIAGPLTPAEEERFANQAKADTVNNVQQAYSMDIPTFVMGVNLDTPHLRDVANAGAGGAASAKVWTADDPEALQDALQDIVARQIPCTVTLDRAIVTDLACDGDVRLNGQSLECNNTTRGWQVVNETTIELLGSACRDWQSTAETQLTGSFPCEVIVP